MLRYIFFFLILFSFITTNAQVNLTSSNLPIVIINTDGQEILDEPKIAAEMGIINNGGGLRNNIVDIPNEYNGKIGIEIRGQSSQSFPMKSYSIELWDDDNEGIDQALFGLPEESDWILYAPYTDKTLIRNFLAYTMSNNLGHWAAHCRYVEVVLNNVYVGVYIFMEKIKRDVGRVNISKLGSKDISGDALTGGYIFSIDKEADGWFSKYLTSGSNNPYIQFSHVYPKLEDINQTQKDYIKSYVDSFENALYGSSFQNPTIGFRRYADEGSFIDYFIVNEISRNVDGYRLSSYFHKDRNSINSKIIAGPVWDYDLAFRNADYCDGSNTAGWSYKFNTVCSGDYWQVPFWWDRFMQDTTFTSNLYCRWKETRSSYLSNEYLKHAIDSVSTLLSEASARHFQKWPILGTYVWPNPQPIPNTYAEEITTLKTWLDERLFWLDNNLKQNGKCSSSIPTFEGSMKLISANPVVDFYKVKVYSTKVQKIYINFIDQNGKVIINSNIQAIIGNNPFPQPGISNSIGKGIYYLQLMNDAGEKKLYKLLR